MHNPQTKGFHHRKRHLLSHPGFPGPLVPAVVEQGAFQQNSLEQQWEEDTGAWPTLPTGLGTLPHAARSHMPPTGNSPPSCAHRRRHQGAVTHLPSA